MNEILSVVHLGASSLSVSAVTSTHKVEHVSSSYLPVGKRSKQTYAELIDEIVDGYVALSKELGEKPASLVVTCPVPVNRSTGIVGLSPGIPALQDRPLCDDIAEAIKAITAVSIKVTVENDANAAALRSYYFGGAKEVNYFFYVRVSTGIGGCIMMNGRPFGGISNLAGEIGHITLNRFGSLCGCGNRGCAETLIGGNALLSLLRRNEYRMRSREHFVDLIRNYDVKDEALTIELKTMGAYLGLTIAAAVNILNPSCVVMSGPLINVKTPLLSAAELEFERRVCSGMECPLKFDDFESNGHAFSGLAVEIDQVSKNR